MGGRSNRREESQSKGRFTRRKEFKLTGGKGTLRRDLIERGGSSEAWYGGGGRDRTASVAGSALNPASPAPTEGASPLVCSPRRGHTPFASPGHGFTSHDAVPGKVAGPTGFETATSRLTSWRPKTS